MSSFRRVWLRTSYVAIRFFRTPQHAFFACWKCWHLECSFSFEVVADQSRTMPSWIFKPHNLSAKSPPDRVDFVYPSHLDPYWSGSVSDRGFHVPCCGFVSSLVCLCGIRIVATGNLRCNLWSNLRGNIWRNLHRLRLCLWNQKIRRRLWVHFC